MVDNLCATATYLGSHMPTGKRLHIGGIRFSNAYGTLLGERYTNGIQLDFTDAAAFNVWLNSGGTLGYSEYQLDMLMFAKDRVSNAYPGLYLAVATDEDSDSEDPSAHPPLPLLRADVATALTKAGCVVFIDPFETALVPYYHCLATNGGAVEQASLGTYTFESMRHAITGQ
jgi:hypothetical protein